MFERLMETVLIGLEWKIPWLYLDDVVVFAPDPQALVDCLNIVLGSTGAAGLKLKPSNMMCSTLLKLEWLIRG